MEEPNSKTCTSNEEDEDTLSLSGLFLYSDNSIEFLVDNPSMSQDFDQDFEFSGEMMFTSHDPSNPVVFCGKVMQVSPQNLKMFKHKKQQKRCNTPTDGCHKRKRSDQAKTKSRWYVLMFGFGQSRYPKKMHIRDLRERHISSNRNLSSCDDCSNIGHDRDDGRSRSRGFIRFLACGGGSTWYTRSS